MAVSSLLSAFVGKPTFNPAIRRPQRDVVSAHEHGLSPKLRTVPFGSVSEPKKNKADSSKDGGSHHVTWKQDSPKQPKPAPSAPVPGAQQQPQRRVDDIYRACKVVLVLSSILFWLFSSGNGPVSSCTAGNGCRDAVLASLACVTGVGSRGSGGDVCKSDGGPPVPADSCPGGVPILPPVGEGASSSVLAEQPQGQNDELGRTPSGNSNDCNIRQWAQASVFLGGTVLIVAFAVETIIWEISAFVHAVFSFSLWVTKDVLWPLVTNNRLAKKLVG